MSIALHNIYDGWQARASYIGYPWQRAMKVPHTFDAQSTANRRALELNLPQPVTNSLNLDVPREQMPQPQDHQQPY